MPHIKHIALLANDPDALAEFYKTTFGMTEIGRQEGGAVFISDGYINLALITARGARGDLPLWIRVENSKKSQRSRLPAAQRRRSACRKTAAFNEASSTDSVGTRVDLSEAAGRRREAHAPRSDGSAALGSRARSNARVRRDAHRVRLGATLSQSDAPICVAIAKG